MDNEILKQQSPAVTFEDRVHASGIFCRFGKVVAKAQSLDFMRYRDIRADASFAFQKLKKLLFFASENVVENALAGKYGAMFLKKR